MIDQHITALEATTLSTLLSDPALLLDVDLTPEEFSTAAHREIYQAILDVDSANEPVDVVTVGIRLEKQTSRNWMPILIGLCKDAVRASDVGYYARQVREHAQTRRAGEIARQLADSVAADGMAAVDAAVRDLIGLGMTRKVHEYGIKQVLSVAVDQIDEAFQNSGTLTGVPSGLEDLDKSLGGFHPGDLIVIGARPAAGKTAFMLNIADRCGVPCGIISGEQGHDQIGFRLLSMNSGVSVHHMRTGKVTDDGWPRITSAVSHMVNRSLWVNDKSNPSIDDVMRQARKWHHNNGIKILLIDYLQKLRGNPKHEKRVQVAEAAACLKELARDLQIPVVVLAQVNRGVEARANKRPMMSDLKESGEIEQEADQILTLYRDEVYDENSKDAGICEVSVCKNRHGPTGIIRVIWRADLMRFDNYAYTSDRYTGAA